MQLQDDFLSLPKTKEGRVLVGWPMNGVLFQVCLLIFGRFDLPKGFCCIEVHIQKLDKPKLAIHPSTSYQRNLNQCIFNYSGSLQERNHILSLWSEVTWHLCWHQLSPWGSHQGAAVSGVCSGPGLAKRAAVERGRISSAPGEVVELGAKLKQKEWLVAKPPRVSSHYIYNYLQLWWYIIITPAQWINVMMDWSILNISVYIIVMCHIIMSWPIIILDYTD